MATATWYANTAGKTAVASGALAAGDFWRIGEVAGAVSKKLTYAVLLSSLAIATLPAGTLTTSQPLTLTQTWNAAVTFNAFLINVTSTTSAAASTLMDLQVGGISQAILYKDGSLASDNYGCRAFSAFNTLASAIAQTTTQRVARLGATGLVVASGAAIGFSANNGSGTDGGTSPDTILVRDAANTLALRNGAAAQNFVIYNTFTDLSNREIGFAGWSGSVFRIGTESSGTGTNREMRFYVAGNDRWRITTSGDLIAATDNTIDIGASGATRPRTGYFGTKLISGSPTSVFNNITGTPVITGQSSSAGAVIFGGESTGASGSTGGPGLFLGSNDGAAMASGDLLGYYDFGGSSSGAAMRVAASVRVYAAEAWADGSAYGSRIEFKVTTNGATSMATKAILTNAGLWALGATVANTVPAFKPSSTVMQARLADDSAFAPLQGALRTAVNAVTGLTAGVLAATTNATIVITDASGQDYRVPCII